MLTSFSQWKSDSSEARGQTPIDQSRIKVLPLMTEMFSLVKAWVLCCLPCADMAACLNLQIKIISAAEKLLVQTPHSFCLSTENISSDVTSRWEMSLIWQRLGSSSRIQLIMHGYCILKPSLHCHMQLSFHSRFVCGHICVYMN